MMRRISYFFYLVIILSSCGEEDIPSGPSLLVEAPDTVKPDSTLILEVTAQASGILTAQGISGQIINGEGNLTRTSLQGENTVSGTATFEFTAGSSENETVVIQFSALDQLGQSADLDFQIGVTSLEIKQVWVLNEGNFLAGNGTVDLFDIRQQQTDNSVYTAMATIQNAVPHLNKVYLVTNAPDRLDVLNSELEVEQSIDQGLDNPIDFAAVGNRGFVSNWGDINTAFGNEPDAFIAIVDLDNHTVIDSVVLQVRPQRMLTYNDKVYIANEGGNSISVLDPESLTMDEIMVSDGPSDLVADEQGKLWVLCTSGNLVEIDPAEMSVLSTISGLTTGGFNEKMAVDGAGRFIYFLGGTNDSFTGLTTVYRVNLTTRELDPFVGNGFSLYGIGVNPESNDIYIGDSNAFQSTGTGFRYDVNGNLLNQFNTGLGPNGFLFN